MAASKEDILNAISNMTVMEVVDLVKMMEEKFGVTAAAPVAMVAAGGAAAAAAPAAEEKTEFNVTMTSFGANKVGVIKVIREITGLGLKEAKDLDKVASLPTKQQALGQLVGLLQAPISKFVRTLAEPHAKLVRTIAAVKDKKAAVSG